MIIEVSKPKILGATATIKAFNTQIKALFGREKVLFFLLQVFLWMITFFKCNFK